MGGQAYGEGETEADYGRRRLEESFLTGGEWVMIKRLIFFLFTSSHIGGGAERGPVIPAGD